MKNDYNTAISQMMRSIETLPYAMLLIVLVGLAVNALIAFGVWWFIIRHRQRRENDVLEAKARLLHSMAEKNEAEARRSKQPSHEELRAKIKAMTDPKK